MPVDEPNEDPAGEPDDLGDDEDLHCPLDLLEAHEAIAFADAVAAAQDDG